MGVVNESVQDGICQGVVTDGGVPLIGGQLADGHGRVSAVTVIHDFHQVIPVCRFYGSILLDAGASSKHGAVQEDDDLFKLVGVYRNERKIELQGVRSEIPHG